uniref:Uncharacterized protein n=1 Tax=Picea glauca TaxID=3330 RepID=A0A101M099_PICGL|nr:hypothetical protein ABT39_MTgene4594 [Picea glauca]
MPKNQLMQNKLLIMQNQLLIMQNIFMSNPPIAHRLPPNQLMQEQRTSNMAYR